MNQKRAEFIAYRVIRGNVLAEEITESFPKLRSYVYKDCIYVERPYRGDDWKWVISIETDSEFENKDLWEYFYWKWDKGIALKEFDSIGKRYDPYDIVNSKIINIIK